MKKNILFGFVACGAMLLSANVATAQEAVAVEEVTITETEAVECGDHFYQSAEPTGSSRLAPVWSSR